MNMRRGRPATQAAFLVAVTAVAVTAGGCGDGSTTAEPATSVATSTETGETPSAGSTGATSSGRSSSGPGSTAPAAATSAQDAVRGYYTALATHDTEAAERYLAPEYLASFNGNQAFAAWVANYRSLSGLKVRPGQAADATLAQQHPGYRDLTTLPVTYTARLNAPSANETDGSLDRFVLVGRSATHGSWLIVDITTSP